MTVWCETCNKKYGMRRNANGNTYQQDEKYRRIFQLIQLILQDWFRSEFIRDGNLSLRRKSIFNHGYSANQNCGIVFTQVYTCQSITTCYNCFILYCLGFILHCWLVNVNYEQILSFSCWQLW